jgi:ribosomal protein S18 acetylase RimI-like enzyme
MSIIRPFRADDLFKFNNMLRPFLFLCPRVLTIHPPETSIFGPRQCASKNPRSPPFFPQLFLFAVWPGLLFQLSFPLARYVLYRSAPQRSTDGIWHVLSSSSEPKRKLTRPTSHSAVLGKAEGSQHDFHGHVTALSVSPEYRRLSLARVLMNFLETVSDDVYGGLFVDLYVRCTNTIAMELYEGLGYSVYRRVREYYGSLGLGPGGKDEEDAFGLCLFFPWGGLTH